jgi:nucleotide-binding universal stress UspA family protein
MKKIALLVDFTGVCQLAMEHTALIARHSLSQVVLLHIASPDKQPNDKQIKSEIREFANSLEKEGIPFAIQIDYGDFFQIIGQSISNLNVDLIIVGTHGIKGVKQDFLGSNVLKLIRQVNIPALIVQGHCQTPHEGYLKILVPLLGQLHKSDIILRSKDFAEVFNSKYYFLSYYNSENKTEVEKQNLLLSEMMKAEGFETVVEEESSSQYTSSYSKSIIEFADIEEVQLIVMLVNDSEHSGYFNDYDKENMLLNRLGKAILCI